MICVFFGAPVFESYTSTLYFSCLMTLLTVYPLIWHFYMTDNISSVFRIIQDNKFDNTNESHLHVLIIWSIIGAWLGAIPIPLDWDRPWQEWPITCCIGAALGSSAAHFFIGSKVLLNLFREKKKVLLKSV
ncbi:phosphatidylinositol-glycan biosynthesis class F protein-like [Uloborus diversus]|uniref:phosphatidylinositol-glycan biosynthesis class F protein-like n=1 Tax=Uloborus diversus TaxID=327109 RepID=UPI002409BB14|nr:phosphatidylinositol-glycan biosynthesis class F protein-like [Uloborus diversus]XP_054718729.1 phosphatidylinositol-glycan biosynthesis class F protein-like [Uloborus diversus]XP_054718730.1 phosphatidylinositol-glycan biosynthesis class F protein-like [Uloborus diversus]XP_054723645.1 phosphatidylinositol-glycan biosynthesis class F protein-like [Uloborus diversus]